MSPRSHSRAHWPGRATATSVLVAALLSACAARCAKDPAPASLEPAVPRDPASCVDGARALEHIRAIVALGPRHAGAPGLGKTRRYIENALAGFGLSPVRQDFTALTPHPDFPELPMSNISVDIPGPGKNAVLLGGHYEAKLLPGVDFKAANDGGASAGLLLEMARCLALHPPPCPVRIVFFDGEEALVEWGPADGMYGSKRLATALRESGDDKRFAAAVIVDMIGDRNLGLVRETLSTPWVFAALERQAARLGRTDVFSGPRGGVEDDHLPLLKIGIPAADLIDLSYGPGADSNAYWHTAEDTIDKLSPDSLQVVGRIALGSLAELAAGAPPQQP
jgi:glutaminyl-peptide cyclotransferase